MTITKLEFGRAREAGVAQQRRARVAKAHYDRDASCLVITLHNEITMSVPGHLLEGLAGSDPDALSLIEISPSGLGLHWPALDADVYVPALLDGQFGSRSWMASILGREGGKASTPAKAAAARANGRKGGRPVQRKQAGRALTT